MTFICIMLLASINRPFLKSHWIQVLLNDFSSRNAKMATKIENYICCTFPCPIKGILSKFSLKFCISRYILILNMNCISARTEIKFKLSRNIKHYWTLYKAVWYHAMISEIRNRHIFY